MKKNNSILTIASIMLFGVALSSCSLTKDNNFNSRKYTHFKKGEATVEINYSKKEINNEIKPAQTAGNEIADISGKSVVMTNLTASPAYNFQQENYSKNNMNTADANTILTKTTIKEKVKRAGKYVMSHMAKSAATASVSANGDGLLLCILAIFLPPLAVFLAAGIGSEFWIDLLLTFLFWIPGVIYAFIVILG